MLTVSSCSDQSTISEREAEALFGEREEPETTAVDTKKKKGKERAVKVEDDVYGMEVDEDEEVRLLWHNLLRAVRSHARLNYRLLSELETWKLRGRPRGVSILSKDVPWIRRTRRRRL